MEEMTHGFVNMDDYEGKKKIQRRTKISKAYNLKKK